MTRTSGLAVVLAVLTTSASLTAQDRAPSAQAGRLFAGASVGAWMAGGADVDPEGYGTNRPHFHGGLDWPSAALLLGAGIHVAHATSVGVEFTWRPQRSANILEQSRGHSEFRDIESRLTDSERVVSAVARARVRAGRSIEVQPLVGFSLSSSTRALTARSGVYTWPGGTLPTTDDDETVSATTHGFVVGADVLVRAGRPIGLTFGARLHGFRRPDYQRVVPGRDPFVFHVTAGLRWQTGRG